MIRSVSLLLFAGAVGVTSACGTAADPVDYDDPDITADEKSHWAYQPPTRPTVPEVKSAARVRNPVDAFVLAKLEAAGLTLSPEADKLTLVRRATLDLTGLPPTPAEVEAFLTDGRPDAYEKLVDRLLASPHHGERWATHWLDVVRFAESNGYEADGERPHAWRYRDYVVRSLNADKPYDVFLTEQLAGDELAAGRDPRAVADLWDATGMHRCGPAHKVGGNTDPDVARQEVLTEIVGGFSSAVLGLTVACARCHDHKFDAISQGDFYRVQAFFAAVKSADLDLATPEEKQTREKAAGELHAKAAPLRAKVAALDAPVRAKVAAAKRAALEPKYAAALAVPAEKRTPEEKKLAAETGTLLKVSWDEVLAAMPPDDRAKRAALREEIHALDAKSPPPTATTWAVKNDGGAKTFVFKRGNPKLKLATVSPAFPRVIATAPTEPKTRLELAKWVTRPDHPLTARVIVNRLWHHHFGRGIVASPNDFGVRGERPTHPELLDWLAAELTHPPAPVKPWSLKHIHRLIVLSATYRQAATTPPTPAAMKADPDNRLLWRAPRRRLEAEAVRDSILTAAGTLNREVGGRSVKVPLEPEVYDLIFTEGEPDGLWPVTPDAGQHTRRSIYLFAKRNVRLPLFEAFDLPDTLNSCAARPVSTFAPQALILMNGPFVHEQGKALAARLLREVGPDPAKQTDALYRRTVGRAPTATESRLAAEFLKHQTADIRDRTKSDPATAAARALADLCVVLFNTSEFVYIP